MIVNYKYNFLFIHIQKTAGTSISKALFELPNSQQLFNNHTRINDIKPNTSFSDLFTFAIVRNPWDRLVSWYNMIINKGAINDFHKYIIENSNNFSSFLKCTNAVIDHLDSIDNSIKYYKSISFNQIDYISDNNGKIITNYIGRFENLNKDFTEICNIVGIKNINLSHLNSFPHANYRDYYTNDDAEKVYEMYKKDIKYFNYEF